MSTTPLHPASLPLYTATRPGDVEGGAVARLDRLRLTRIHVLWIGILGVGYLIETFDNTVFGYLAPSIREEWGLSIEAVGVITSAVFYGMMLGALVGGRLLDRYGRKPVLVGASLFYTAASLICALAPNYPMLFAGRVLTGIGVQAATGAILVYVSEMFPRHSRGRFFTALIFFGYIGAPITAFTAAAIAPSGVGAWRWVFGLGVIGLLVAALVGRLLPETVRWLTLRGRGQEALQIVKRLEMLDARRGELVPVVPVVTNVDRGGYRELLTPVYRRRLIVVSVTFFLGLFCQYGFSAYLATILVGSGMTKSEALNTAGVITLGTLLAAPVLFIFADRIERKTALLIEGVVVAIGLAAFGSARGSTMVVIAGVIVYAGLAGLVTSFYNFIPEIFPTEVRGAGTGLINGVGRLAGVLSSLLVAAMYTRMSLAALFFVLAALAVLSGLIAFVFGPRTSRRSLEDVAPTAA